MYLDLAVALAQRLDGAWDALDGTSGELAEAVNACRDRDLVDVIQCPNCMQIVRLPEPIWKPDVFGRNTDFRQGWVPPRVPPHDCSSCSGDWDCPRDINWEECGMRGPCTEEHEDVEGGFSSGWITGLALPEG